MAGLSDEQECMSDNGADVKTASQIATFRYLMAGGAVALMIAVPLVTRFSGASVSTANWIGLASFAVGSTAALWIFFGWRPRCPKCRIKRAKFVRREDDEYLVCECGYNEATGWGYQD